MSEERRYPEYIGISDVRTLSHEYMRVEAFSDGQHSILADEPLGFDIGDPPVLRGQSRGWTPVHYQLAGLATCTAITITVVANDQQFAYRGLQTAIRSLIDIRGFFFDLHLQPEYKQVNFDLTLDTDEPVERIIALAHEADRRCPQLGLFHKAEVPLLVRWHRAGTDAPVYIQRFFIDEHGATPEEDLIAQAKVTLGTPAAP